MAALLSVGLVSMIFPSPITGSTAEVSRLIAEISGGSHSSYLAMLALSNVLVGPVAEEVVWRGICLPSLASKFGLPLALILSSLGFAAYHLSWEELPALTLVGLVLGIGLVQARGNLAAPILAHVLYNAVAFTSMLT